MRPAVYQRNLQLLLLPQHPSPASGVIHASLKDEPPPAAGMPYRSWPDLLTKIRERRRIRKYLESAGCLANGRRSSESVGLAIGNLDKRGTRGYR